MKHPASALLLVLCAAGFAAAQMPPPSKTAQPRTAEGGPFVQVDEAIEQLQRLVSELPRCTAGIPEMERDLAQKKKDLQRRFGGVVPPQFQMLLQMKASRIQRRQTACRAQASAAPFDRAMQLLSGVEPKTIPGFDSRREKIEDLRDQFNDLNK